MKKSYYVAILSLLLLLVLGIFLKNEFSGWDKPDEILDIGFVVPTLENPFFEEMANAAEEYENDSIEVLVQASTDELKQNQIIENFISQGVDVICVVPINSETIIPAILLANKAGIPVINVDNKIDTKSALLQKVKITTYIGSNNFDGGELAGLFIAKELDGKGEIIVLEGINGNDAAIQRKSGFEKAINSFPGIKIVASQAGDWNRQKANEIISTILSSKEGIDAIFASNDEMALGALAASKSLGLLPDDLVIVGFDAIDEAKNAVANDEIDATIAQQPRVMGSKAVELAIELFFSKLDQLDDIYATPLKIIEN